MNSSVKFFEPIVMAGLPAFWALLWITLLSAAGAPEDLAVEDELLLSLLSLLPQAARPRAAASASTARTLRDRIMRFLLIGVGSWGSLRPRGVMPRCRAANRSSAA